MSPTATHPLEDQCVISECFRDGGKDWEYVLTILHGRVGLSGRHVRSYLGDEYGNQCKVFCQVSK